jgi:hypothetical protein
MRPAVIFDLVARGDHLADELGSAGRPLSHDEKGRASARVPEHVEHLRGIHRIRAVVEGQGQTSGAARPLPD